LSTAPIIFPKALPTLRHKLYPVRAIPGLSRSFCIFLSLAIQENVNAIHHLGGEVAFDGERFGAGQRVLRLSSKGQLSTNRREAERWIAEAKPW
jgi:hypothetical protein